MLLEAEIKTESVLTRLWLLSASRCPWYLKRNVEAVVKAQRRVVVEAVEDLRLLFLPGGRLPLNPNHRVELLVHGHGPIAGPSP